jgi:hypothetical protein
MFVLAHLLARKVMSMVAEMTPEPGDDYFSPSPDPFELSDCSGPNSARPPQYDGVPAPELFPQADAERQARAATIDNESLAAGFWPRPPWAPSGSGSGFASGGILDRCPPGAPLARLTDAATRDDHLAGLEDDELIGVLRAWRRLESWCNAGLLKTIAELAHRRPADRTPPAPRGSLPEQLSEFITDELAAALTLSGRMAGTYLDLSLDLAIRLPGTARALHEGTIDHLKARLIAEATRVLTDDHAKEVEARILPRAGGQTLGQLRAAVARAVLAVDPQAAIRRREEAQKDPRVSRWQEDAGTAALAGFGLPPAEVLEADQRITARALALREAGLPGSLEELRARSYLDTLLGQDSTPPTTPAQPPPNIADRPPAPDATPIRPDPSPPIQPDPSPPIQPEPSPPKRPEPSPPNTPLSANRRLPARVNLTVPLLSHLGLTNEPGHVAGFGPVDPALARQLTTLAATDPASRFCITLTGPDGRAIGHGCIPGRPPDLTRPGSPTLTVTLTPLAQDTCTHRHQDPGYQASRNLQHLIRARTTTCSAPGCQRPAARCDLDHTKPYDQGGLTCECNLAPLCRHHHRCKQSQGWHLDQPEPGIMRWTTPPAVATSPPQTPTPDVRRSEACGLVLLRNGVFRCRAVT